MLQIARLAPASLGESRDLVPAFLRRSMNPDGGFPDRAGQSDLYYTVFGLEGLLAFGELLPPQTRAYLDGFDPAALDLVHLSSLVRSRASLLPSVERDPRAPAFMECLSAFRAGDGGYAVSAGAEVSTIYASFLALGIAGDLHGDLPEPDGVLAAVRARRSADGGYANHPGGAAGTPSTAAAVMLLRHLGGEPDDAVARWLLARCHPQGGFLAAPAAPMPDLLSTATALHALAAVHAPVEAVREPCLDFLDTLWTAAGGFHGSWADGTLDCEYTYYGLLALGHLSL